MRTKEEMDKVHNRIKAMWACTPQLRLGQLIENALELEKQTGSNPPSLFNMEDEDLNRTIERYGFRFNKFYLF